MQKRRNNVIQCEVLPNHLHGMADVSHNNPESPLWLILKKHGPKDGKMYASDNALSEVSREIKNIGFIRKHSNFMT